ncbi:unnamed protein product, partial [Mesorhabditis spiculigera]
MAISESTYCKWAPSLSLVICLIFVLFIAGFSIYYIAQLRTENGKLRKRLHAATGSSTGKRRRHGKKRGSKKRKRTTRSASSSSASSNFSQSSRRGRNNDRKMRNYRAPAPQALPGVRFESINENMRNPAMPVQVVPMTPRPVLFTGNTPLNSTIETRGIAEKIRRPFTPQEFGDAMGLTVKFINEYTEHPETRNRGPWWPPCPRPPPQQPEEYADVIADLKKHIMPMLTHWQHPRFLAYFPTGRNHADILSNAIEAALSIVGFSYDSCPAITELEVVAVNWLAQCFGLPKGFHWNLEDIPNSPGGGFYLPSASDGVFDAVMAARDWKFERFLKKYHEGRLSKTLKSECHRDEFHDLRHQICQRLVVYTSKDAHSCLEKACKMAMVRCHPIQATAENEWGITGAQLEEAIKKDREYGLIPLHVHVTLGTTSTAACDHLKTIWPVARKYKMWLHVDAAYAGGAWVEPKFRGMTEGLQHATSLNINLNKFFMHVSPGSVFWTQDKDTLKKGFSITPTYLKPMKSETMDLRDYGIQLTRTFRALRTWILMRTTGIDGLRFYINTMVDFCAYFEELIIRHPNVRPFCKRSLGLFCFYYMEPGMTAQEINSATRALAAYINDSRELFITRSCVAGHDIIRISINYINTTREVIEQNVAILSGIIDRFRPDWQIFKKNIPAGPAPLEGRNTVPGAEVFDIDLKGTPLPDVDPSKIAHWSNSPNPESITRQDSLTETYRLPNTPHKSAASPMTPMTPNAAEDVEEVTNPETPGKKKDKVKRAKSESSVVTAVAASATTVTPTTAKSPSTSADAGSKSKTE